MTEQDLQLSMPGGIADAVLFTPNSTASLPGVLQSSTSRARWARSGP